MVELNLTARRDGSTFADPHDMALHGWVQQRFADDLARHGLSRDICAREDVCPDAAEHFRHTPTAVTLGPPSGRTPVAPRGCRRALQTHAHAAQLVLPAPDH